MTGVDGLSFLRKAKLSYDIFSVALFSCIDKELRRSVSQMIKMLDFEYLGDLGKSPSVDNLQRILDKFSDRKVNKKVSSLSTDICLANFIYEDFELGLKQGNFVGFYQPKFDVSQFSLRGAEVLARWVHPQFGLLHPGFFIESLIHHNLLDDLFFNY